MDKNANSAPQNAADSNNVLRSAEDCPSPGTESNEFDDDEFVERYLTVTNMTFSILPNGGTGDCLYKAISQAIFDGDESEHLPIRQQVVAFIAERTWEKYQVSIQVQHINGHSELQKSWDENSVEAYKNYMLEAGTLGSFLELNAAGELYQFNFASIQEYNDANLGTTYRVENSMQFPDTKRVPKHYFLFTGDFENGHWEYLKTLTKRRKHDLADGMYNGNLDIVVQGQITSVEFWLMENTQIGQPEFEDISQLAFLRRKPKYPFDCPLLRFENDKTVDLIDVRFVITPSKYSDLFSVLANCHLRNENLAKDMHDLLTTYRNNNFSSLNYKLITQPHSHGFTTEVLKYASQAYKGNIQDLLSAADLYGFSFTIYMIITNVIHSCKFVHVDRWGDEVSTMEYFFIHVIASSTMSNRIKARAHWYHLVPVKALNCQSDSPQKLPKKLKSKNPRCDIDCEQLAASINSENKKYIKNKAKDLYNLYFDNLNVDGGDYPMKARLDEPENYRSKEISRKSEKKALEESSQLIEMKPNVVYKYGSDDATRLPLQINNKHGNRQNANAKSHNTLNEESCEDLRMTPSNLLYSRPSVSANRARLEKKASKPVDVPPYFTEMELKWKKIESVNPNFSFKNIGDKKSKEAFKAFRSIGESPTYNNILQENTHSLSVSSGSSSVKSVCSNFQDHNKNISDGDSNEENEFKNKEFVGTREEKRKSKNSIDDYKNSNSRISVKVRRRESEKVERRESEKVQRRESGLMERKESEKVQRKESEKVQRKESEKVQRKESVKVHNNPEDLSESEEEGRIRMPTPEMIPSRSSLTSMLSTQFIKDNNRSDNKINKSIKKKSTMDTRNSNVSMNKVSSQNLGVRSPPKVQLRQKHHSHTSQSSKKNGSSTNSDKKGYPTESDANDSASDKDEEANDIYSRYYRRQSLLRKSDGELLAKKKQPHATRSLSERLAKFTRSGISVFSKSKHRKVRPTTYSISDKNNNPTFTDNYKTLPTSGSESNGETIPSTVKLHSKPKFSQTSVSSGSEKAFMRQVVNERMRKESTKSNIESLQTLRSNRNSKVSYEDVDRDGGSEHSDKKGCLGRVCNSIGSICGIK